MIYAPAADYDYDQELGVSMVLAMFFYPSRGLTLLVGRQVH